MFEGAQVISEYSRSQAIKDGVLVDVSDAAKKIGFRYPVAMTQEAFGEMVRWTETDSRRQAYQDESARLRDVLSALKNAAQRCGSDLMVFDVYAVPCDGESKTPVLQQLKAVCGPGDTPSPVITILLPHQD